MNNKNYEKEPMYFKIHKRIAVVMLSTVTLCKADSPWQALVSDMTASMMTNPVGDFSARKIAVVDNGFVVEHGGLKGRLTTGFNGRDGDTNVEASIVMDANHHEKGKYASHGTHVAGIIAQISNHTPIVPCKRGSSGKRNADSDAKCLKALIGRKDIEVVNLSFGLNWDKLIEPIIQLAQEGKTIVVAAGNSNSFVNDQYLPSQKKTLSTILHELNGRVVLVGATDKAADGVEKRAHFSNKPFHTLAPFFISARGTAIKSYVPLDGDPSGAKEASGTSMAAPVFAGALMRLATQFDISIDEARQALFETAIKKDTAKANVKDTGHGIIDFKAAWNFLKHKGKKVNVSLPVDNNVQLKVENECPVADNQQQLANENKIEVHVEDLTKARIFTHDNIEEIAEQDPISPEKLEPVNQIKEDLEKAQIFSNPAEDLTRARIFTPEEIQLSNDPAVIDAEKIEKKEADHSNPQTDAVEEPIKPAQEVSASYFSRAVEALKGGLAKGYDMVKSVTDLVVFSPIKSAYHYLRSWF